MIKSKHPESVPVIDVKPLVTSSGDKTSTAAEIGRACRENGFFYITGHGIDETLQDQLSTAAQSFFALPLAEKNLIPMSLGGSAWRGYFPVGGELTSGVPDWKEGLYFGDELPAGDLRVKAGVPMHGANLFPAQIPELQNLVMRYLAAMTGLGHALMTGIALSLGKNERFFYDRYTKDPFILFRIFNYPDPGPERMASNVWGVGEHTDYGILTILKQDDAGGLQVKSRGGWIDAPPIPGTFVCNIGDMLDLMTDGIYRSTPHRVKNTAGRDRMSFPFFFDPNFNAAMKPIDGLPKRTKDNQTHRWDGADIHAFQGTYGDYVLRKVGKVFPQLASSLK